MALSNFNELKKSIISWSHRRDLDLLIDDFILLSEKDMFKGNDFHEPLAIRGMETTSNTVVSTRTFALPTGYISMRSINLQTSDSNSELKFKSPDALVKRTGTGRPRFFTVDGQIEFDITPDQSYTVEIKYFQKPTALSTNNVTNVILTDHPDIYLFGSLWSLFTHADDEAQAQKYQNRFSQAIDGANQEDEDGRYGPAPYARIEGPTP